MRKILSKIAVVLTCSLISCQKDNFGYEKIIYLSAEGEELDIKGEAPVYSLSITDFNGNGAESDNLSADVVIKVTYQWLSAVSAPNTNKITVTSEPNTSGKNRTLYLRGMVNDTHTEIKIIQKK
ncbi:MAG: BACON domain-containing protein [Bacteroidales bacterium]|nr:BACON domain-containing protein [Bacteroidales bacterium]